jgi:hypothetical protein
MLAFHYYAVVVYCENSMKNTNTLYEQNVVLMMKSVGRIAAFVFR